jgi:two-component system sensor histidine kinase KdpD
VTRRQDALAGWVIWGGLLLLTTATLVAFRGDIDQSHAALTMLLVVLGGSVAAGRPLGFTLAIVGIAMLDLYFQPPFGLLTVNKPLDWVILFAFLATATVTTDLVTRARQEAAAARQRASEVASLSVLGAATLRHANPEDALDAIAALVRDTLGVAGCVILSWSASDGLDSAGRPPLGETTDERRAAESAARGGLPVTISAEGELASRLPADLMGDAARTLTGRVLALPLRAEERIIGVLVVRGDPLLALDAPRRRFLSALAYYAALGLERRRLMKEAAATESLREANRAKDQILASVSHDLRTPLTTIKVLAQGAESRGEPSAPAIVEQADRLAQMVGDLLELSRLRVGSFAVNCELNTAEDVVGAALRRAQGILGDRTIVPHIDLESPALVGDFDFVHTLRILGNLLDNALRYTPLGGAVDLDVAREGEWLCFTVADRGCGVQPRERERIFEAFYRPANAVPDAGHPGLGLSIARTLAEAQGGTLEYAARDGGGSSFLLRLRAADLGEQSAVDVD